MKAIEYTYTRLLDANECENSEEFSVKFLKRSRSYYRTIKALNKDISYEVACNLLQVLEAKSAGATNEILYKQLTTLVADKVAATVNRGGVLRSTALRASISAY